MSRFANRETLIRAADLAVARAEDHRREAETAFKAGRGDDGRAALDAADAALAEAEEERTRYVRADDLATVGRC